MGARTRRILVRELRSHFPDRWEVTGIQVKTEGDRAFGAIWIHCLEDDKVFLTDFDARLDPRGKVTELELDGVNVGKFMGRQHRRGKAPISRP